MYSPTDSHENSGSRPRVRIGEAGDLLAAVPAMLGFHPHRSMVLIGLKDGGTTIGPTMRHDLIVAGDHLERTDACRTRGASEMVGVIDYLARYCASEDIAAVIAVFVDDRLDGTSTTRAQLDTEDVLHELETTLAAFGVHVSAALAASTIAHDVRWWSMRGPFRRGRISDPSASPLTVARVLDGQLVRPSRTDLAEVIARGPASAVREAAVHMMRLRRDGGRSLADELETVLSYLARAPYDSELDAADVARVGVAIGHVRVRDSLLALTLGDDAGVVEDFWASMARSMPDCERAVAATLLAFSAYVRGDGPMARIAIDAALESDDTYSLAQLLDRSLRVGAGPELVREVAESGFACARTCGVLLPGDPFGRR